MTRAPGKVHRFLTTSAVSSTSDKKAIPKSVFTVLVQRVKILDRSVADGFVEEHKQLEERIPSVLTS